MKTDIIVTSEDRARLERLVGDRNTPAKVVWRAQIVLAVDEKSQIQALDRTHEKALDVHLILDNSVRTRRPR
jgi:hypothetical protein